MTKITTTMTKTVILKSCSSPLALPFRPSLTTPHTAVVYTTTCFRVKKKNRHPRFNRHMNIILPRPRGDAHVVGRYVDASQGAAHPNGNFTGLSRSSRACGDYLGLPDVEIDQVPGQTIACFRRLFLSNRRRKQAAGLGVGGWGAGGGGLGGGGEVGRGGWMWASGWW